MNLWEALKERPADEGEEVVVVWSTDYRYSWLKQKMLSAYFPKLRIMVYRAGAFAKLRELSEGLTREWMEDWVANWSPIAAWTPPVFWE